jgi:redox-sensitive bicupin YhaK (pirin superfamily)
MKKIAGVYDNPNRHWVGNGFPTRTLFYYGDHGAEVTPFLLLDYGGPHQFASAAEPRGVGQHPHRGFETVTIVYDGEIAHRDSTGGGGTIGPGDVQWMTAGGGILHDEFHSPAFTRAGGLFRGVQLWVNLPAADKMSPPRYQSIVAGDIPQVVLPDGAGQVRVIAGAFQGQAGPAQTFSPIDVWDARLNAGSDVTFETPEGHTMMVAVLSGRIRVNGDRQVNEAEMVLMDRDGVSTAVAAETDALLLVLSGAPIHEPIVGYGPFVMNSEREIHQAYEDFRSGRFGALADATVA